MSGVAFRARGASGGPAPRAYWLSPLADKFTCLLPWTELGNPTYSTLPTPVGTCNYANQYNPTHGSLTSFTTAPDGTTNTAQKFIEDTSNNMHYLFADLHMQGSFPVMRNAAIFKAAERTRIAFAVKDGGSGNFRYVGFDLAGVQIAYPPVGGVSVIGPESATITSLGGGWCLCIWDVGWGVVSNHLASYIILDNGSGTGAQSTTYTGDGFSGVYGWRCSLLPKRAWSMGSVSFFDGFDDPTLAEIDVNNTKAPGFKWYVDGAWTGPSGIGTSNQGWLDNYTNNTDGRNFAPPITPGSLSASGSVLTFPPTNTPSNQGGHPTLTTAACAGGGNFVGQGFKPPYLLESSFKYPFALTGADSNGGAGTYSDIDWWTGGLETAAQCSAPINAANPVQRCNRTDGTGWNHWNGSYWEVVGGDFPTPQSGTGTVACNHPNGFGMNGTALNSGSINLVQLACDDFEPNFNYDTGRAIYYPVLNGGGTNFWKCASLTPQNTPPPDSHWSTYNYGTDVMFLQWPPIRANVTNVFQVISVLILPWDPVSKDPGCLFQWYQGSCVGGVSWRPFGQDPTQLSLDHAGTINHTVDWQHHFVMFWGGQTAGSGLNWSIDYVKVTQ